MKSVTIDPEIAMKYGSIKIAYLFVEGIKVSKTPPRQKKIARDVESKLRNLLKIDELENDNSLNSWLALAKKMGIKNDALLPAQLGLIKSILVGRDIPKINNIVDAGNIISAKYRCPVGIFDASAIVSDIYLRVAQKDEGYLPMFSEHMTEVLFQEIVYADRIGIFSRYSKDADRTKITEVTNYIFCVIDGTAEIPLSHIIQARDELSELLKEVAGSNLSIVSSYVIAKENN